MTDGAERRTVFSASFPSPARVMALLLVMAGVSACGADPDAAARHVRGIYAAPEQGARLVRLDYDRDRDGWIDQRTYMNGNRALRSEIDADEDGLVDRWEYYGAGGAVERVGTSSENDGIEDTWAYPGPDQQTIRIERSTFADGRITRREFYEGGRLARAEEDTDGDGRVDRWETYRGDALAALALDTTGQRGRPDRRWIYGGTGELERVEVDPDGDGVFTAAPADSGPAGFRG